MSSSITVRNIDPGDKIWLQGEARRMGLSMEAYVRKLIGEHREKSETREKPSEVARRLFGAENGIEPLPSSKVGYRPLDFQDDA